MASAGGARMTREEHRKQKELDEARKNGDLPPEQDDEGNLINPHIPEFMSKAPWYLNQEGPGLKHQKRFRKEHTVVFDGLHTVAKKGFQRRATVYRKGACKNCGAMSHKTKECTEKPRKRGAWKTGKKIAADEILPQNQTLSWDGKRDRYNGYDAEAHKLTIARFNAMDAERQKYKQEQRDKKAMEELKRKQEKGEEEEGDAKEADSDDTSSDEDSDGDSDDDVKQSDAKTGMVGSEIKRVTTKTKSSVRNLRLREDLPKYLRNLDVNSAYYDPHTRSMRENPNPHLSIEDTDFVGDNAIRNSGEASEVNRAQLFCWDANRAGEDSVHMHANPTQAELLRKQFKEKKATLKDKKQSAVLEKYGGQQYLRTLPKELLYGATETYVEYARDGRVIKGQEKPIAKSKYEEDVYLNNHTAVWGSFFNLRSMEWGYACCHQCVRNSICTGEAGKAVKQQVVNTQERKMLEAAPADENGESTSTTKEPLSVQHNKLWGENLTPELDAEKLKKALKKVKKKQRKEALEGADRKRKYNSLESDEVTAEEMEAWRMSKVRSDDPMAKFFAERDAAEEPASPKSRKHKKARR